jgi:hypothetical protein
MSKVAQLKPKTSDEMIPYDSGPVTKAGRITLIVDGRTPLLTHNPESMQTQSPGHTKASRIPEAEVEAEAGCYRFANGEFGIKGDSFRGSLLGAAGAWKGKNKSTMKSRLSHVTIVEDLVRINYKDGSPVTSYEIDARRAMVQKNGIIRRRPKFTEWSCQFTVEFDPLLVPEPKLICDIFNDAGGRIGVGDFRPSKNGWFGRYSVRSYRIEE